MSLNATTLKEIDDLRGAGYDEIWWRLQRTVAERNYLLEENLTLKKKLKAARLKLSTRDKLRVCREIKRLAPVEQHRCTSSMPKWITRKMCRSGGCYPMYDFGVGVVVFSRCESIKFLACIEKTETCWMWTGTRHPKLQYGTFSWDRRGWMAHRIAYTLFKGAIPFGFTLDHLCRNRTCVNPEHLEPVTLGENARRRPFSGRPPRLAS